jgi:hypothetical protein
MKYRLQALDDDGLVRSDIEIDALYIPQGGDLVVSAIEPMPDAEWARFRKELQEFLGEERRVLFIRVALFSFCGLLR